MKKEIYQEIEIPEGVEVKLEAGVLNVKGPEGENKREFKTGQLDFEIKDNKIILGGKKLTKKEKKIVNTFSAHIRNMVRGVQKKFEYKLKICFSHFPITVDIQDNKATIKNFLGEKINRKCSILNNVEIDIKGQEITLKSFDKEAVGQTAANFEIATKIRNKDQRVFQDGIYITNKDGREM